MRELRPVLGCMGAWDVNVKFCFASGMSDMSAFVFFISRGGSVLLENRFSAKPIIETLVTLIR